mmetsp:Transcript_29369/g.94039  ORF Transcript_29369/g.94039 Transcript_29369/m.94039 type:complete len:750 (+) Transcript_29369:97-2346(+)
MRAEVKSMLPRGETSRAIVVEAYEALEEAPTSSQEIKPTEEILLGLGFAPSRRPRGSFPSYPENFEKFYVAIKEKMDGMPQEHMSTTEDVIWDTAHQLCAVAFNDVEFEEQGPHQPWMEVIRDDVTSRFSILMRSNSPDDMKAMIDYLQTKPSLLTKKHKIGKSDKCGVVMLHLSGEALDDVQKAAIEDARRGVDGAAAAVRVLSMTAELDLHIGSTGLRALVVYHPDGSHTTHRDGMPRWAWQVLTAHSQRVNRYSHPGMAGRRMVLAPVRSHSGGNGGSVVMDMGLGMVAGGKFHGRAPYDGPPPRGNRGGAPSGDGEGGHHVTHAVNARDQKRKGHCTLMMDGTAPPVDLMTACILNAASASRLGINARVYLGEDYADTVNFDGFVQGDIAMDKLSEMNTARGKFGGDIVSGAWQACYNLTDFITAVDPEALPSAGWTQAERAGAVAAVLALEAGLLWVRDSDTHPDQKGGVKDAATLERIEELVKHVDCPRVLQAIRAGEGDGGGVEGGLADVTAEGARIVATGWAAQDKWAWMRAEVEAEEAGGDPASEEARDAVRRWAKRTGRLGTGSSKKCNLTTIQTLFNTLPAGTYLTAKEAQESQGWPTAQYQLFAKLLARGFLELDPRMQPDEDLRYGRRHAVAADTARSPGEARQGSGDGKRKLAAKAVVIESDEGDASDMEESPVVTKKTAPKTKAAAAKPKAAPKPRAKKAVVLSDSEGEPRDQGGGGGVNPPLGQSFYRVLIFE